MTGQAQVPAPVAAYFGAAARDHPVIVQAFTPGKGWTRYPIAKRVSVSWVRKMKAEGVTGIALACDGRLADFGVAEILHAARPLPMFGGRVI